jgi:hypothetical protein
MAHGIDRFGGQTVIARPDEVRGVMGKADTHVDRHLYLVDRLTDIVWEADAYIQPKEKPDEPDHWWVLLLCPCCQTNLRIDSAKKPININERGIETGEPIACGNYLNDVEGFTGTCPFRAELEPPPKPEFIEISNDLGIQRVKVDAWIRRAF